MNFFMTKEILRFCIGFLLILILFIIFIISLFFISDTYKSRKDPCYNKKGREEVGKGFYGFIPEKNLVCMLYMCGRHSFCYKALEGVDYKTFKNIGGMYFTDKNHVYYGFDFKKVKDANLNNFIFLENFDYDNYAKDDNNCYEDGNIVDMSECEDIKKYKIERESNEK